MTDTTDARGKGKRRGGAGLPVRDDLFDQVWGMVQQIVADAMTSVTPTMGTVVGRDGGSVRVNMDEEGVDRQVGFPRSKGVDYQSGDRVLVHQVKGGQRVILGKVDSDSNEQAVDGAQMRDRAVGNRIIDNSAVDTGNIRDRSVTGGKLDSGLESKINNAASKDQLDNYATKSSLDNYAKSSQLDDKASKSDLSALEKRVKKLEDKKNK
jgi:hypothetical protein